MSAACGTKDTHTTSPARIMLVLWCFRVFDFAADWRRRSLHVRTAVRLASDALRFDCWRS
eukprot:1922057-Rhodomonas_salina.1